MIRIADEVSTCDIDGELVILDRRTGHYFGLNSVASRILACLAQGMSLAAIKGRLSEEFDAGEASLESDILAFFKSLKQMGFIVETED